jgi:glycosyltransferase involved in cell wall biosynthesis
MSHRVHCLVVGPFPPPLHGFSAVTAAICGRFEAAGVTSLRVNTASPPLFGRQFAAIFCRLSAVFRLTRLLTTARPSTVYLALSGGSGQLFDTLAVLAARAFRCRVIFHHHSYSYLDRSHAITGLLVSAAGKDAIHIALCPQMARTLQQHYPRAARVVIISNASIVGHPNRDGAAPKTGQGAGVRTIGFLSNITIDKGIERFIVLVSLVREFAPQVAARVAGPIAEARAGALIDKAVAGTAIAYLGPVYGADKDKFLEQIDALIFPSIYPNECEPLVVLEALRAGVPVIATARGCIPSMVDESCGLLIDRDARDLAPAADRIRRWIDHPAEFAAAREAACLNFERLYREGEQALQDLIRVVLGTEILGNEPTARPAQNA